MRRLFAVIALAVAVTPALGGIASATPIALCVPVPDGDGHVMHWCAP